MTAMLEHDAQAHAQALPEHDALAYATDGRTDALTEKGLRGEDSFSNASRAGGLKESTLIDAETLLETHGISHGTTRARVTRSGEREPISHLVRTLVYRRDRWSCQRCGAFPYAADANRRSGALHLDHITPWSAGGSDRTDNLRTLCGPCNMDRSNFMSGRDKPALPIVRICALCLCRGAGIKPEASFDVYCASRSHVSWAIEGWSIL